MYKCVYISIWNAHPSCFSSKSGWSNSVNVANVLWKLLWRSVHISLSYTHYVKYSICGKVTHVINKNRAGRESLLLSSRWGPYRLKWAFAPVTPGPKKISVHGGTSLDSNINSWKSLVKKILVSICYKTIFKTFYDVFMGHQFCIYCKDFLVYVHVCKREFYGFLLIYYLDSTNTNILLYFI